MTIIVTGAAGFIGFHTAQAICRKGEKVIGIDNLNDYYDIKLKRARLAQLEKYKKKGQFELHEADIADYGAIEQIALSNKNEITHIVHLAAQAGVRYSLQNPFAYAKSNLLGHLVILEIARKLPKLEHLVYASSSSVYGGSTKLPFGTNQNVDSPISLYAATKKSDELMSYSYSHLYGIPMTGLRFFTVYGPWGRPDMAYFIFTKSIIEGKTIDVYGKGELKRDFTFVDDVVDGILRVIGTIPKGKKGGAKHAIYNLGNNKTETVNDMLAILENAIGKEAKKKFLPIQPGDMAETYADISESRKNFGFNPKTRIKDGLPRFVEWYKEYYKI